MGTTEDGRNISLVDEVLEIDYCLPVPGGVRIFMSGQTNKGVPFGTWKIYDLNGTIIKEFSENHMDHIYEIKEN